MENIVLKNWLIIVLMLFLVWRIINQNYILLIIITFLVWKSYYDEKKMENKIENKENNEQFDADMVEFLPVGEQRYDLRGMPLYNRPPYDCWNTNYGDCYNSNF